MYLLVLALHVVVCLFLITVILVQGGRGGLGEAMGGAAAQSLFGGGANIVMTKITAVSAAVFLVTSLGLAALSTARGRSVIDQYPVIPGGLPLPEGAPFGPQSASGSDAATATPEDVASEIEPTAESVPATVSEPADNSSPATPPPESAPSEASP